MKEGKLLPCSNHGGTTVKLFCSSLGCLSQLPCECLFAGEIWPYPHASCVDQPPLLPPFLPEAAARLSPLRNADGPSLLSPHSAAVRARLYFTVRKGVLRPRRVWFCPPCVSALPVGRGGGGSAPGGPWLWDGVGGGVRQRPRVAPGAAAGEAGSPGLSTAAPTARSLFRVPAV